MCFFEQRPLGFSFRSAKGPTPAAGGQDDTSRNDQRLSGRVGGGVKVCGWHMANWSEDAGEVPWRGCGTERPREGTGSAQRRGSTTRVRPSSHSAGQTQLVLQQPRVRRPGHHLSSSQDRHALCFMKRCRLGPSDQNSETESACVDFGVG